MNKWYFLFSNKEINDDRKGGGKYVGCILGMAKKMDGIK